MNLLFWYRSLMRSVGATLVKLIATATSGLVSFTTNVIRPVKVTCEFTPVQEGTGDPSPDNVRPISGWTGCSITDVVNLLVGVTFERGTIAAATGQEQASTNRLRSDYIWLVAGTYTVTSKSGYKNVVDVYDSEKAFKKNESYTSWSETSSREFTLSSDRYIRILFSKPDNANITLNELTDNEMLIGSQSTNLPITFTDPTTGDPMTVYGGTLTLNEDGSGELAVEWEKQSFSSSQGFSVYGSNQNVTVFRKTSAISKTPTAEQISNIAVYDKNAFSTAGNPNVFQIGSTGNLFLKLSTSEASTTTELNTLLSETPLDVVFKVGVPTTYNLTAEQVNSLIGTNTIWHDMNGDITVEYWNKQ